MFELETRSFEARFGNRCPFCGKSWNDRNPCGDNRADWGIRDGLRLLFSDRTDNCVVCGRQVQQGRKYCFDCGQSVQRYRNRQDRHRRATGQCALPGCGKTFERRADKKHQRYCSLSCGNRGRTRSAS